MVKFIKKFIGELQESPEPRKRKWLAGISTITMALVVLFWISYLSSTIDAVTADENSTYQDINASAGFWPIMRRGAGIIYDNLWEFAQRKIDSRKEINIDNSYQFNNLPPIPVREIK